MHSNSEEYTAFNTRYRQFQYQVMPLGLRNAPSTFQRMMHIVLNKLIDVSYLGFGEFLKILVRDFLLAFKALTYMPITGIDVLIQHSTNDFSWPARFISFEDYVKLRLIAGWLPSQKSIWTIFQYDTYLD
jgi:hypothetical protein